MLPTLELGEAHVALWPGAKPETLDYVVVPITEFKPKLFASRHYTDIYGFPATQDDLKHHAWVTSSADVRSLPNEWLRENLSPKKIALLSNCRTTVFRAVVEGLGIGMIPSRMGHSDPRLVPILPDLPTPTLACWGVTHVDTLHTVKIKSFVNHLKNVGREWLEFGLPQLTEVLPKPWRHEAG
ncbi:MAG: LysR substrate-binding domain-containing protein [Myxococcota bacterium]